MKVTVPVGAAPADGPFVTVTVAVNVTACPKIEGFVDDVSAVVESAFDTTWSIESLLVASCAVSLKVAVIVCVAAVSADVVSVACPLASSATAAPRLVAPSVNATVPVVTGLAPLVTVAVNVTLSPKIDGFSDDVERGRRRCPLDDLGQRRARALLEGRGPVVGGGDGV